MYHVSTMLRITLAYYCYLLLIETDDDRKFTCNRVLRRHCIYLIMLNYNIVHVLHESNGHASVAYYTIGKHLARIRLNTTSSEANLPTLLYKALNALKKHDLLLSKLHLRVQSVVKNTTKYQQQSTQLMAPPEAVVSGVQ